MNKKALMLTALIAVAMMATPLVPIAQAEITEEHHYGPPDFPVWFTEYYGTLSGANFYILIPDDWTNPLGDGMLVVLCRSAAYVEDPRESTDDYPFALELVEDGIAVAASNYVSIFSNASTGAILTHELALYAINEYHVTGKVFLCGTSLGGAVALLLGEKYPNIYSGVLDISGVKDSLYSYYTAVNYLNSSITPDPDPFLSFFFTMVSSLGLPDPEDIQNNSPNFHADISIPVISIVHYADQCQHPIQTEWYHGNVSDPDLHMVVEVTIDYPGPYTYPSAIPLPAMSSWYGHFDPYTLIARAVYFPYLVEWSNGDIGTGDIPPVFLPPEYKFDVIVDDTHYPVSILSNSTVSNFNFSQTEMQISFNVTGDTGTTGYCNVTILKSLLTGSQWTIKIDDTPITDFDEKTNDTHTFLYFTYTHESPLQVTIEGTWVIPELPPAIILSLFMVLSLITVVFVKHKEKKQ